MKILGMGMPELLIILAVILLIFGPTNLPKLGSALGKTVKNLRDGMGSNKSIEEAEDEDEEEGRIALHQWIRGMRRRLRLPRIPLFHTSPRNVQAGPLQGRHIGLSHACSQACHFVDKDR